jgi:DNA-binding transcriptional regulator YhcF (GntR family)
LGLVEGRLGLGTFVIEGVDRAPREYHSQSWRDIVREGVTLARSQGIDDKEIVDGVRNFLSNDVEARS